MADSREGVDFTLLPCPREGPYITLYVGMVGSTSLALPQFPCEGQEPAALVGFPIQRAVLMLLVRALGGPRPFLGRAEEALLPGYLGSGEGVQGESRHSGSVLSGVRGDDGSADRRGLAEHC